MTTFRLATEADDALIRAILRENTMSTWVELALEREPSYFAGKDVFGRDWAVVARENGDVIGIYTASVMPVHVDGQPRQLGYLGGLRVKPQYRRRIRHLREGYASIRTLAPANVAWWFTVIAAENSAARRLLERGLPGFPRYQPQGDYVTFAIPTTRARRRGLWRKATDSDVPAIVRFHNEQASQFQCSPVLTEDVVRRIGNFYMLENGGGVAALWDQRAFKQVVARRYRRPALIPLYNIYARLFGRIPLPRQGQRLEQTSVAFLALSEADAFEDLLSNCKTPVASIGLHAEHPLIDEVRRFKPIPYPARVYAVTFDDACVGQTFLSGPSLGRPDKNVRPTQPEAALL